MKPQGSRLVCPQCGFRCITQGQYQQHLKLGCKVRSVTITVHKDGRYHIKETS